MKIIIDLKPISINTFYKIKNNRFYTTPQGKLFKLKVRNILKEQNIECIDETKQIRLNIIFEFKDKRKRDIDNYLKVFIDSLKEIYIVDDCQIFELQAFKKIGCENDRIIIDIDCITS